MSAQEPLVRTTRAEAARIMLEAYEAGRLSAQAPRPEAAYFLVDGAHTYRCAVGQLFTEQQAERLQEGTLVGSGERPGYVMARTLVDLNVLEIDDTDWLVTAQGLHDTWASYEADLLEFSDEADLREQFAGYRDGAREQFLRHVRAGA